jgi:hypothetical protein
MSRVTNHYQRARQSLTGGISVPPIYNEQSTLTVQVSASQVTRDFQLKSRPPR